MTGTADLSMEQLLDILANRRYPNSLRRRPCSFRPSLAQLDHYSTRPDSRR